MSQWIKCSDRLPEAKDDTDTEVILAVKRASGKTYVFAASFLQNKELYSEEDDADDEGRIYVTGWYELRDDPEYDTAWHQVLNSGDSVTHWMPLPAAPDEEAPPKDCPVCDGWGSVSTGIDEAPSTLCKACDGNGSLPK